MSTFSAAVTVGRNVGDTPMSGKRWAKFQGDVYSLVFDAAAARHPMFTGCIEWHLGKGSWEYREEDSFRMAVNGLSRQDAEAIAGVLAEGAEVLRVKYKQEAIAVTVGETILVEGV